MGHAVRANYLYAGVADLYAETGEAQLMKNLTAIWDDIVQHKIYIMGGCGALYDGVSPDGTTYDQPSIQQIHQAYGRQFQLPQEAAHNEICAQIGMLLFSWRMYQVTGDGKYLDIIENELYNGILSGISLDGRNYFYTEALRRTSEFPYTMRWPKQRQHYISCFCCPPNTTRTLSQVQEYAYSLCGDTLCVNLYGQNELTTADLAVSQHTDYPWNGLVTLTVNKARHLAAIRLHIPHWADGFILTVNGTTVSAAVDSHGQCTITRRWQRGDVITLDFPMQFRLIEANPLVEEATNQVAVMRGPIVYCLEAFDIQPASATSNAAPRISDIAIPADIRLQEVPMTIAGHTFISLQGNALVVGTGHWDNQTLYRPLRPAPPQVAAIRLIPYYAWDNRGFSDMSLWLPLANRGLHHE
jgi:hypothetical protein